MRRTNLLLTACLLLMIVSSSGSDVLLVKDVLTTAGGQASSASYRLGYCVGQTVAGWSLGHSHGEWAGFWGGTTWGRSTMVQEAGQDPLPTRFLLHQNFPNPFNPQTHISYQLPRGGQISLDIFNIKGQLVFHLVDEYQNPGEHIITWNGTDRWGNPVSSGVYFYRLMADSFHQVRKMLLLK
jgi:hypothetical protein